MSAININLLSLQQRTQLLALRESLRRVDALTRTFLDTAPDEPGAANFPALGTELAGIVSRLTMALTPIHTQASKLPPDVRSELTGLASIASMSLKREVGSLQEKIKVVDGWVALDMLVGLARQIVEAARAIDMGVCRVLDVKPSTSGFRADVEAARASRALLWRYCSFVLELSSSVDRKETTLGDVMRDVALQLVQLRLDDQFPKLAAMDRLTLNRMFMRVTELLKTHANDAEIGRVWADLVSSVELLLAINDKPELVVSDLDAVRRLLTTLDQDPDLIDVDELHELAPRVSDIASLASAPEELRACLVQIAEHLGRRAGAA